MSEQAAGVKYTFEGEEALKNITDLVNSLNALTSALAGTAKEESKTSEETDKLGKKTSNTDKLMAGLSKGITAAKGPMIALAGVAAGATAALGAMFLVGKKGLADWQVQQEASNSLKDSLQRTGLQGEELSSTFTRLYNLAGDSASKTLFGNEEQEQALAKYVQTSKNAAVTEKDLSAILGIATKEKKGAVEAAKIYALASKGEIGPLKELTGLTKEQETALNKMSSSSERGAAAQKILQEQFGGLAEQAESSALAVKVLDDAKGGLSKSIGKVISDSKVVKIALNPLTTLFNKLSAYVDENNESLQKFALGGLQTAFKWGRIFIGTGIEILKTLVDMGTRVRIAGETFGLVWEAAGGGFLIFYKAVQQGVHDLMGEIEQLLRTAGNAALAYNESLGLALLGGAESMVDAQAKQRAAIADTDDRIKASYKGVDGYLTRMTAIREEGEKAKGALDKLGKTVDTALLGGQEAAGEGLKNVKASDPAAAPKSKGGKGKGATDDIKGLDEAAAKKAEEAKKEQERLAKEKAALEARNLVAQRELEIVKEANQARKAALQLNLEFIKIAQNEKLTAQERELANTKAILAYQKELKDLETERAKAAAERLKADQERAKAAQERESKRVQALGSSYNALGGQLANVFGSVESRGINAFSGLASSIGGVTEQLILMSNTSTASAKDLASSVGQAGGAIAAAAGEFGASQRIISGIQAAFYTAEGFGQASIGNIPGSIAAFTAAGLHGAIAAGATGGVEAKGKTGGGAASKTAEPQQANEDRKKLADAIAGALDRQDNNRAIMINFDFSNSTTLESSPAVARKISGVVQRDLKSQGISLNRLRS